jgi:hypothetical protein
LHHGKYFKCRISCGVISALLWYKDLIFVALVSFTVKRGRRRRARN